MTLLEAIRERHAVRSYTDRKIEPEKLEALRKVMDECNYESHLHIQLVVDDPKAFDSRLAHYGKFSGVSNYFALIGAKGDDLDERLGYYGERLTLEAQRLGLNTCWVGLTFKKNPEVLKFDDGEKLRCVIALGYGTTQGVSHKVKPFEKVARSEGEAPQWFRQGVAAALLAPTAMNQQKFTLTLLDDSHVSARAGLGFFTKVDLGIVKYNFEVGAGSHEFQWV